MSDAIAIYVFRAVQFAKSASVATAAPLDLVVSVFGGGGIKGERGLEAVFGGSTYYRDDATGSAYLGVWGARNASRFRRLLRESGAALLIIGGEPPARLVFYNSGQKEHRPKVP